MAKISGVCVGESLVGDGNEVAHVDLLVGPRGSAVEQAFCNALTNNKDGFTTLLAVIAPNLLCKPPTILYNKVTIKDARQAVQMFGPAQYAVAKAVAAGGVRSVGDLDAIAAIGAIGALTATALHQGAIGQKKSPPSKEGGDLNQTRNPTLRATAELGPVVCRSSPDLGVLPFSQRQTDGGLCPSSR